MRIVDRQKIRSGEAESFYSTGDNMQPATFCLAQRELRLYERQIVQGMSAQEHVPC